MSFFNFLTKNKDPDVVYPLTDNLNNYVYFDPNTDTDLNLFKHVNRFVANEFTKVIVTFAGDIPGVKSLDYLLNVKPNSDQTGNQMLYVFAKSMLDHGFCYYKVTQPANHIIKSIEISAVNKPGFTQFKAPYLKHRVPDTLIQQYQDLLVGLSTKQSTNVLELNTKLKANTTPDQVSAKLNDRLSQLRGQINKYGAFTSIADESTSDHANLTLPDGTALQDLRNLIYETLNINPKLLTGDYSEEDYRAFYSTHLMPLKGALEELLNQVVIGRDDYIKGCRINIILDLMQFSTLESFTNLAKEGLYNGYLTANEIRSVLGKDKYPDPFGDLIMGNKNAVILNNEELNDKVATKPKSDNEGGDTNNELQND